MLFALLYKKKARQNVTYSSFLEHLLSHLVFLGIDGEIIIDLFINMFYIVDRLGKIPHFLLLKVFENLP